MNIELLLQKFKELFPYLDNFKIIRAPGRINLIGEHTDYNDGYVLPAAVDKEIIFIAGKTEKEVILHSLNFENTVKFTLPQIEKNNNDSWGNFPMGIFSELLKNNFKLGGVCGIYEGNVPVGSGMSSSAAVQVATLMMIDTLYNLKIDKREMARLTVLSSHNFVGVKCGIMDQFISLLGEKDSALFIDCRTLVYEVVPLGFENINIVVCNTKVKRELSNSEYNLRHAQCEKAKNILQKYLKNIKALRDVSPSQFEDLKDKLDETSAKRARHVIYENERVKKASELLKEKKLPQVGELLYLSHYSLKHNYEVSSLELDIMVDIAKNCKGVLGARLMGAGFGGCTINLVEKPLTGDFVKKVEKDYEDKTKIKPDIYVCKINEGAGEIYANKK